MQITISAAERILILKALDEYQRELGIRYGNERPDINKERQDLVNLATRVRSL